MVNIPLLTATTHLLRAEMYVPTPVFAIPDSLQPISVVSVVLFVGAILAFALNPRDTLVRTFALLLLTSAVIVGADPAYERHDIWGMVIEAAANGLGPALFLRFCLAFPDHQCHTHRSESRWLRAAHLFGPGVPLMAAMVYIGLLPTQGWLAAVGVVSICVGIAFGLLLGLGVLAQTFLHRKESTVRAKILVVWLGAAFTFVPLLGLNVIPAMFLHPMLIPFQQTSYTLLFLPLSVGFASVRWRTVSFVALIDRVSVYIVLALLLLGCYAALSLIATTVEGVPISSLTAMLSLALAIIAATTFAPVRTGIQRLVDTVFFRDYYDLGPTMQRFSRSLAMVRDRGSVADSLLDDLCVTLNLTGAALLLLPGGFDFEMMRLVEPDDLYARRAYADPVRLRSIVGHLAYLDPAIRQKPQRQPLLLDPCPGCAALVPIRPGPEGEIGGLLLIGPKRSGGPLRAEDRVLLATVAHQTATALENALLVGGLHTTLTQLRRSTDQLEIARAEQRLLLREIVDTDERQRATLARELHDDALQDLLYVSRHSRYCASKIATLAESADAPTTAILRLCDELDQLAEAAATSERKVRDLCAGLYPAVLESLGLPAALETLAEDLTDSGGRRVRVTCTPTAEQLAERLSGDTRLHAYRIVQEAMRNASRHAHAQHIDVRLAEADRTDSPTSVEEGVSRTYLLLTIVDDGDGITLPLDFVGLLRAGHLGLASMRERAQRIGAELTFRRNLVAGTTVTVLMPTPGTLASTSAELAAPEPGPRVSSSVVPQRA